MPPRSPAPPPASAVILVVDGDRESDLAYLLARYAKRGGFGFGRLPMHPRPEAAAPDGHATLWLSSLEQLEAIRPREIGLIGDDSPVIVCSSATEEARAHSMGADLCVPHPLQYMDFLGALRAVGVAPADTEHPRRAGAAGIPRDPQPRAE
jgi:hypothetical protein